MRVKIRRIIISLCIICFTLLVTVSPLLAKTIKLRVTCPVSPRAVYNWGMLKPWSEMIYERTNAIGKPVKITIFSGESIVKHGEHYKAVLTGTVDVSSMIGAYLVEDGGGVSTVMNLPFLFQNTRASALTALDLAKKWPEFLKPYSKAKLMWFQPTGPSHGIFSTKKQIKTLEDLKGLKTRSGLALTTEVVEALGGFALDIQMLEIYQALERGLLDYISKDWEACMAFKWFEVTKYRTILPMGLWSDFLVTSMNWDSWNSLPKDVQKIFEELNGRFMTELIANKFDEEDHKLRGVIKGIDKKMRKADFYFVPDGEFQRWKDAVKPVYEKWVKDMEAKGLPGREILEDARKLAEKYSK